MMGPFAFLAPRRMTVQPSPFASAADWRAAADAVVVTDATGLGVLVVSGADAAAFLHGQLSNDIKGLAPWRGCWATYNSPKGRMLATLFVWRVPGDAGDRYLALVSDDIAEAVRKRLAMFVLRSKVVVADETSSTVRFGVGGPLAADAMAALGTVPARGHAAAIDGGHVVGLPDGRFVIVATMDAVARVREALRSRGGFVGRGVWSWLSISAGLAMITATTQDQFVAQTANWDALGGLDFHKGCYPGQEIVARTHYLGRLKERMYVLAADAPAPAPGTRLYSPAFGEQACGTVVESAPAPQGGSVFLAIVQRDAANTLALGAPGGPPAQLQPLPYPLPEPAEPRGRVKL